MSFKFSKSSLERLATCHPDLQKVFNEAIKYVDFTIIEGHRNKEGQEAAFKAGNTTLHWPHGYHNKIPSMAVDAAPYPVDWKDFKRMYLFAGFIKGLAQGMGIRLRIGADWDGDFKVSDQKLIDTPHFELLGDK